jgi:hypothetical protein
MKKIFYLFTVIATMFAITSCDTKGNSITPTDPKSGIEGTWVVVNERNYYDFNGAYFYDGNEEILYDGGYATIYTFKNGKMSVLYYHGILDGNDFLYVKNDNSSAPSGIAIDYWMEDGLFYNMLLPAGCKLTFLDEKHLQMEGGYMLRKLDKVQLAPQENPMCDTYWAPCDEDGNLEWKQKMEDAIISISKFRHDNSVRIFGQYPSNYINGVFVFNSIPTSYGMDDYIYAPNDKTIY